VIVTPEIEAPALKRLPRLASRSGSIGSEGFTWRKPDLAAPVFERDAVQLA
jgi:hypothetical protein